MGVKGNLKTLVLDGSVVTLRSGESGRAVTLGTVKGTPKIRIKECKLRLDVKIDRGVGIGSLEGNQDIKITNAEVSAVCAGSCIAALGSVQSSGGSVKVTDSALDVQANGQKLVLIGSEAGGMEITFTNSVVNLKGEGNEVLGIGCTDDSARITSEKTTCNVIISSGIPKVYGAKMENLHTIGGVQSVRVNE